MHPIRRSFVGFSLACVAFPAAGETLAYWQFEETSGQVFSNSTGDSSLDLYRGTSTAGSGFKDPAFAPGLGVNGSNALEFSDNAADDSNADGDVLTFGASTSTYSKTASQALRTSSFTLEAFVNPTSLPEVGDFDPILYLGVTTNSTGNNDTYYRLDLVRDSDTQTHLRLSYTAAADAGTAVLTSYSFDTASLTTGQLQYVAAVYDDDADTLRLHVDDQIASFTGLAEIEDTNIGGSLSNNFAFTVGALPSSAAGAGTFNWNPQHFDGLLDSVRISDEALAVGDMLVVPVPEPGAMALLSCGALLCCRRRRAGRLG